MIDAEDGSAVDRALHGAGVGRERDRYMRLIRGDGRLERRARGIHRRHPRDGAAGGVVHGVDRVAFCRGECLRLRRRGVDLSRGQQRVGLRDQCAELFSDKGRALLGVNRSCLVVGERGIIYADVVHVALHRMRVHGADVLVRADQQRGDGVDGRGSHVLFAVERAVDIELDLVARLVEGNGDMLPSAACHRIVAENVGRVDIRVVLVGRAQRKQERPAPSCCNSTAGLSPVGSSVVSYRYHIANDALPAPVLTYWLIFM